MDTGFNEEQLRFDLIEVTGTELKKVASDTSKKISEQLKYIEISSNSFETVKDNIGVIEGAVTEIDSTFQVIATDASHNATRLEEVTSAMGKLEGDFEAIAGLVKVINSIADQTNLLALNATIEAARAGESGKGFAVVANEVKELSKTTKTANEDIQSTLKIISSSIQELSLSLSETKDAIENSLKNVSHSKESFTTITSQTSQFGNVIQQNISDFQSLASHTYKMNTQVTELSTIGETFTNLLEMMNIHGLFEGAGNPIDRLAGLVSESEFSDQSRFTKFEEEVSLKKDDVLISATDKEGRITFANTKFYELAEYDFGELLGKPHNVIRHPDMPKTAFADLWKIVESGHLWQGIVKNKTKFGKFYWVKAMVFPCYKDAQIVGFISVRKCPTKEEIHDAIEAYKKLP